MITRTLANLRSQVSRFLDEPIGASERHTLDGAAASINAAIRRYQLLLTEDGITLESSSTLTTSASTASANGWPANEVLALPSDFMSLRSLSIRQGSRWIPMSSYQESERDAYENLYSGDHTAMPTHYRIGTDNAGAALVRLMPAADAVYSVRCIYVPDPVALVADGDTHSFIPGTEEWVEIEAAIDMMVEDGVPERDSLQVLREKQARTEQLIRRFRRLGQGPGHKVNTRAMRQRTESLSRNGWYG